MVKKISELSTSTNYLEVFDTIKQYLASNSKLEELPEALREDGQVAINKERNQIVVYRNNRWTPIFDFSTNGLLGLLPTCTTKEQVEQNVNRLKLTTAGAVASIVTSALNAGAKAEIEGNINWSPVNGTLYEAGYGKYRRKFNDLNRKNQLSITISSGGDDTSRVTTERRKNIILKFGFYMWEYDDSQKGQDKDLVFNRPFPNAKHCVLINSFGVNGGFIHAGMSIDENPSDLTKFKMAISREAIRLNGQDKVCFATYWLAIGS